MSWIAGVRIFSGIVALWSLAQVAFLIIFFSSSPPSPTAELVSTHRQLFYLFSLALCGVGALAFGALASFNRDTRRIRDFRSAERRYFGGLFDIITNDVAWEWAVAFYGRYSLYLAKFYAARSIAVTFYVSLILALLTIFLGSTLRPRYEIFVDLPRESIVRQETHLLPRGVGQKTIPFSEVSLISGEFDDNDYVLRALTREGGKVELGRSDRYPASDDREEMSSLAKDIAQKSGARLDLR